MLPQRAEPRGRLRLSAAALGMNAVFYPFLAGWTLAGILLFPAAFLVWKLITGRERGRVMRDLVWVYGRVWMYGCFPFVRFRAVGLAPGSVPTPSILVVNHLSFLDTYCMAALPVKDIVFAVRSWPFRMPWYAPFMRLAGYLDVERMTFSETADRCREIFARNGCVLFFPEGHRSRDGRLQRFYSGAFRLAVETGVPVVPLCVTGTDVLLPPGRKWVHPATVRLRALDPVDPGEFPGEAGPSELKKHVKRLMAAALAAEGREPRSGEAVP